MDNRKYIHELFTVVGTDSVLVIDKSGRLRRIHCPFRAIVKHPVGNLRYDDIVQVEAVKMTLELQDVFIINNKAYFVVHFKILI